MKDLKSFSLSLLVIAAVLLFTSRSNSQTPPAQQKWECAMILTYGNQVEIQLPDKTEKYNVPKRQISDLRYESIGSAIIAANELCKTGWEVVSHSKEEVTSSILLKRLKSN